MSTQFVQIDKNIITEGMKLDFDIFIYSESNNKYETYIKRNTVISYNDKAVVKMTTAIFITEDRHDDYLRFTKSKAKIPEKLLALKFKNKSLTSYNNALIVLEDLFYNIESFKDNSRSKEVAVELVETILDTHFNIKDLMTVASPNYFISINSTAYNILT